MTRSSRPRRQPGQRPGGEATVAAAYAQDQLRLSDAFQIVAGLRFDGLKIDVDDLRPVGGGALSSATASGRFPGFHLIAKPRSRSTTTAAPTCTSGRPIQ